MPRLLQSIVFLALALATWLPAGRAVAGGFSNPDVGARRMGMFAVMGKPDDGTAVFHNPAGLVLQQGTHLYHAQSWFFLDLGLRLYDSQGTLHPKDHELSPTQSVGALPFLGVTTDFGTEKWRAGVAIYAPNAYGAAMSDKDPTRYHATEVLFLASRASFVAAYAFDDRFSLALGVDLVHVYLTATRFLNPLVLADPDRRFDAYDAIAPYDAKLEMEGQDWTYAWTVSMLFRPLPTLGIGAQFASGSPVGLEGDVTLTYQGGSKEKTSQYTRIPIPFCLRAGFNWEFAPGFEWGADIFFWHYQVFQEQRTTLKQPVMGIGEFVDPKGYGNSWAWNTGLLYRLLPEVDVMIGWQMDFTPIPSRTYTLDNPSRDQKGVSAGVRWRITPRWSVGLAVVRNWFDLPNVQDSLSTPPSNGKGHGANFEAGFEVDWKI